MTRETEELGLPWQQGAGSYNDACRIESQVQRQHPQGPELGIRMTTRARIAHVVETRAGQGARTAAFIVRACNAHHELAGAALELRALLEQYVGAFGSLDEDRPTADARETAAIARLDAILKAAGFPR